MTGSIKALRSARAMPEKEMETLRPESFRCSSSDRAKLRGSRPVYRVNLTRGRPSVTGRMRDMDRLRTLIRLCSGLGLLVAGWMGCARAPGVEVPYVQTPSEVVMEMLRLARVTPDDVVYDLGSGDGRLVIAAARYFGARGVGIELDPALVAESKKIARRAGVAEQIGRASCRERGESSGVAPRRE